MFFFVAAISLVVSNFASADPMNTNFSFYGKKFGEALWDDDPKLILEERYGVYGRILTLHEKNKELLDFGGHKLNGIRYMFFDRKLYSIEVDFDADGACNAIPDVIDLINEKYSFFLVAKPDYGWDKFKIDSSSGGIRTIVKCDEPLLEKLAGSDKYIKYISVEFKNINLQKVADDYLYETSSKREIDAKTMRKEKIRNRVNF